MYNIAMDIDLYAGCSAPELLFVNEYLKDFNVSRAASCVCITPAQGRTWLNRHQVRSLVDILVAQRAARIQIDADWVLAEYKKLYDNSNLSDFTKVDKNGNITYDFSNATYEQMGALQGLSVSPGEFGTKIKANVPARDALLKQIGMHVNVQAWRDQLNITGEVNLHFDADDADA